MPTITIEIPLDIAVNAVSAIDEMCQAELATAKRENVNGNCDLSKHIERNVKRIELLTDVIKRQYGG